MQTPVSSYARVNITLPRETLQLIDRVTHKTNRSGFVDRAVRFYLSQESRKNLRKQLRAEAEAHAEQDLRIAEEWFSLE